MSFIGANRNRRLVDVQFLSKTRILGYGTTQMRCVQPSEYLAEKHWLTGVGCLYRSLPRAQRVIIFHRANLDKHTEQHLRYAKARGLITIYDTDDLLFEEDPVEYSIEPRQGVVRGTSYEMAKSYQEAMKRCDVVLVSTNYLKQKAETFHNDVRLVKNGLSREFMKKAEHTHKLRKDKTTKKVTVAYLSGSKHHDYDFKLVEDALIRVLEEFPETCLLLMGKLNYSKHFREFGNQFKYIPFMPYREYEQVFKDIDINIVPLITSQSFAQARSELKYIEAGICGIPTIASPTGTYCEAIMHGFNGLIANDGDWYEALKILIVDQDKRRTLGEAAREDILKKYSYEQRATEWDHLIVSILEKYSNKATANPLKVIMIYMRLLHLDLIRRVKIYKRLLVERFSGFGVL